MEPKAENGDAAGKTKIENHHLKMQRCECVALGNPISKDNLFVDVIKNKHAPSHFVL